jgi:hypothetical protein
MRWWRGGWVAFGVGLVSAGACSSKVTVLQPWADDDVTTTHTVPTTTSWTTSSGTSTTWTTSTPAGCSADLSSLLGASAACNSCAGESCCAEAEALEASPDQDTYNALSACAVGDQGQGPCLSECYAAVCGSDYGYVFFQACVACLNTNCCTSFAACSENGACDSCLWTFEDQCCSNNLFVAWDTCGEANCMEACLGSYCTFGG